MDVTVNRKDVLEALQAARKAVYGKTTLPILSCVLLRTEEAELAVTGYDMELAVTTQVPAAIQEAGELTAPAQLLADWLKASGEPVIGLKGKEKELTLSAGPASTRLEVLPAEEYPAVPDPREKESRILFFPAADLQAAVAGVKHAAGKDETRYIQTGLALRWAHERLWLAATDGHRLARIALPNGSEFPEKWEALLPARSWQVAAHLLGRQPEGEVEFCVGLDEKGLPDHGRPASLSWPGRRLVSRQIEGLFPDYDHLFSQPEPAAQLRTPAAALLAGLKTLLPIAREEVEKVKLEVVAEGLRLTAEANGNTGSNLVPGARQGGELELAVNGEYLAQALQALPKGADARLDFFGPLQPVRLRSQQGSGLDCLIMPMQL